MSKKIGFCLIVAAGFLVFFGASAESTISLDPITVTATSSEKTAYEVPGSMSIIDEDRMEVINPQSVDDVIRRIPNTELFGGPRTVAEKPSIRGLDQSRIVVRVEGARMNFAHEHKGQLFLDPEVLGHVDVYRGPNTQFHGSGALGGVITFGLKNAKDHLEEGEIWGSQVKQGFYTNNSQHHNSFSAYGRIGEKWDGISGIQYRYNQDLRAGNGKLIPNSKDRVFSGFLKTNWTPTPFHTFTASGLYYMNDNNVPLSPNLAVSPTNMIVNRETSHYTGTISFKYQNPANKWFDFNSDIYSNGALILEGGEQEINGLSLPFDDRTFITTHGVHCRNNSTVGITKSVQDKITLGVETYRDEQGGSRNGLLRPVHPLAHSWTTGFYVQNELKFGTRVTATAALRHDVYNLRPNLLVLGAKDFDDRHTSPSMSASWEPIKGIFLYGQYAQAFRAPSMTEAYIGGVHFPGNRFVPNNDLRPETAHNKEIGTSIAFDDVFKEKDKIRGHLAYFRNRVENYIDLFFPSQFETKYVNISTARLQGVEADMKYEAKYGYTMAAYSHVCGKDIRRKMPLTKVPADKIVLEQGFHLSKYHSIIGGRAHFVFDKTDVPNNPNPRAFVVATPGYTVLDLFYSWEPMLGRYRGLRFDFGIDNVLNRSYRRYLSPISEMGMNIKFGLRYRF